MTTRAGPEPSRSASVLADAPEISVVVPTVDRVAALARCLRGVAAQRDVSYEVIVVHDGDPGIIELIQTWADRLPIRTICIADRAAAQKRNAGWRAARSTLVAFTDDDCEPTPGWLRAVVDAFEASGADLVQGRVEPHPDDATVDGPFRRTVQVTGPAEHYPNANLAYRRDVLEAVGGYDEAFWGGGEDADLAWRVIESGRRAVYADGAVVYHEVRAPGLVQHLRSLPRWQTLALMVRRHPACRRLAHRRLFWKRSHAPALLALVGLVGSVRARPLALLALPLVVRRVRRHGLIDGGQLVVADVVEVGVLIVGSLRYRAVLL